MGSFSESQLVGPKEWPEMTELNILTLEDWKKEVLSREKPVVVDFRAPWCLPLTLKCKELAEFETEVKSDAEIFQIDVTQAPAVAMYYRLMDFPTLALFHQGELLKSYIGMGRIREMKLLLKMCLDSYVQKSMIVGS